MKITLKFSFLLIVFAALVICASYLLGTFYIYDFIEKQLEDNQKSIGSTFQNHQELDSRFLSSGLDILTTNQEIREAFLSSDRQQLYLAAVPLFEQLKQEFEITHFYFILPDGTCFLRVHDPGNFGDRIERASFKEAVENGRIGSAMELGKNVFALRVVKPYFDGDQLIGYVEFSKEIAAILENFSGETDDKLAILGNKPFLSQSDWATIRQKQGLPDNWDAFPDHVLIAQTGGQTVTDTCLSLNSAETFLVRPSLGKYVEANGKKYSCSSLAIPDKNGNSIATLVIAHNIDPVLGYFNQYFKYQLVTILALLLLFVFFCYILFYFLLLRPIASLRSVAQEIASGRYGIQSKLTTQDELGELARHFNEMSRKLTESNRHIQENTRQLNKTIRELNRKNKELEESEQSTFAALEEVTLEKDKSHSLAHDLEKFKLALDNTSEFILITDPQGIILYSNRAARKAFGQCNVGDDFRCLYSEKITDEFFRNIIDSIKQGSRDFSTEIDFQDAAGRLQEHHLEVIPIFDDPDKKIIFLLAIFRDITREKAAERAKTEFISLASHQLRTPLSSIKWLVELLQKNRLGKLNKKQQEFMETIRLSTERLVLLIRDLLNISHIETGSLNIAPVSTKLEKIARDVVKELAPQAKEKRITVTLNAEKGLPSILIDPIFARQIILNLLSNAIKYTPSRGKVELAVRQEGTILKTTVKDNGMGIPKDEQAEIFKRFFRASNVQQLYTDGTGLGLYIAKSLLKLFGGEIGFSSLPNKGTTFWFTLPAEKK